METSRPTHLTYDTYELHCRYLGMVSKLTKNPEKSSTGIAVTGPTNVATWGQTVQELRPVKIKKYIRAVNMSTFILMIN